MADEVVADQVATPEAAAPEVSTPPPQVTQQAVSSVPSDASAGAAPTAPAASPAWFESFKSQGIDLGADENTARQNIAAIYRQHQQMQPILPYANAYQQHAREFAEYLASKQQQQQSPSQQKEWYSEYWNPPEYQPDWEQLITRDQEGNLIPVRGAPPDVVPKYLAHLQHQRQFAAKFMQNPYKTLEEPIRHLIRQEAQTIAQAQLAQHTNAQKANQFVAQHSNWLYEHDQGGQIRQTMAINPMTGQAEPQNMLSPWGQRLNQYISDEFSWQKQNGVYDPDRVMRVAYERVQRDAASYQLQQQTTGNGTAPAQQAAAQLTTRQASNQRALQNSPAPVQPGTNGNVVTAEPKVDGSNIAEFMRNLIKENGLSGTVPNFHGIV